jgi:TRAP-type C4-dicarboxylate transport system permease small subunit
MVHFIRIINSICQWICWVPAFSLAGMMLLTSSDVVLRYFGHPIKGAYDIVGLLGAVVIALPIAYTQILGRHVAMEFMSSRGSKLVQTITNSFVCLISIGAYALIAWQCSLLGAKLWRIGAVSNTVEIPLFPFAYVIAFGCALNCFALLIDLRRGFTNLRKE